MTKDQFNALVKLMRGKPDSPANLAARAVLVGGASQADAMRQFGVTRSTVGDAVRRYAEVHELLQKVYASRGV
ncbi:TrfB-related DNA-binding protein [Chromobacterium vaccinii]|uniref:TrfB-related DNA-binding protein n=1 Tax=Chromobacterium vaccinii TaxID=1108595 RepID=UPI003C7512D4